MARSALVDSAWAWSTGTRTAAPMCSTATMERTALRHRNDPLEGFAVPIAAILAHSIGGRFSSLLAIPPAPPRRMKMDNHPSTLALFEHRGATPLELDVPAWSVCRQLVAE